MDDLHIGISYRSDIKSELFDDFISSVSTPDLRLSIEERQGSIYAGIEWLIPTVIFISISKSYFDGFLKEMGKEHYHVLKKALKNITRRLLGPNGPRFIRVVSGRGKVPRNDKYSLVFSVVADVGGGKNIKLLIQNDVSQLECEEIISSFMAFLDDFHNMRKDLKLLEALGTHRGRTFLVESNRDTKTIDRVIT